MQSIKDAAAEFLADRRIAVTGVSRTPKTHGSNNVYRRLREHLVAALAQPPVDVVAPVGLGCAGNPGDRDALVR